MVHGPPNITYVMVWEHMVHPTLQIYEGPRLTNRYVYKVLGTHGSRNITNSWFEIPWLTKRYVCNCFCTHGSPNHTNTMVWGPTAHQQVTYTMVVGRMAHQTIQILWFYCQWLTKRYMYRCVGAHCKRSHANTIFWRSMAHPTIHIQRFATHGSQNPTNTIICMLSSFSQIYQETKKQL